MDASELVDRLWAAEVISRRQRETINSQITPSEKNEVLLDIFKRRSSADYKTLIRYLEDTQQGHVAQLFNDEKGLTIIIQIIYFIDYSVVYVYQRMHELFN